MLEYLKTFAGISLTFSDFLSLLKLIQSKSIRDFSILTFIIFIINDFSGFLYINKIFDWKSYLASMGPGVINSTIVGYYLYRKKKKKNY